MTTVTAQPSISLKHAPRSALKPCSLNALDDYQQDLIKAYYLTGERYLDVLTDIVAQAGQVSEENNKKIQSFPYQLWGMISAASKRAKRQVVFNALLEQKNDYGVDIPPSVVHHVGRVLLGRGFDEKVAMRVFADKGRTAADKTETTVNDLLPVIDRIAHELRHFETAMQQVRTDQEDAWHQSDQYERIYRTIIPYISQGIIDAPRLVKPVLAVE